MALYQLTDTSGNRVQVEAPEGSTKAEILRLYRNTLRYEDEAPRRNLQKNLDRLYDTRIGAAETLARNREASLLDYAQEVPKGLVSGAAGILESGALGLAALLPDNAEEVVRDGIKFAGDAVQDYLAPDLNRGSTLGDSVPRKLSEAGGSFAGIIGASLVNPIAGAGLAVTAGMGEASERARAAGASADDRFSAALQGIIPGAFEIIPAGRLVRGIKQVYKGTAKPVELITNRVARALREGGIEGAQEVASGIAQNMIEQGYNPTQGTFEGSGEAAGYGGAVGAIAQALIDLATPRAKGGRSSTDLQGELFPDEDLGQAPVRPTPDQAELFPDADLGQAPARPDERQLDLFTPENQRESALARRAEQADAERARLMERPISEFETEGDPFFERTKAERDAALAELAVLKQPRRPEATTRDMRDMVAELQDKTADERAREREGLKAAARGDVEAFEQPDLFAQELEREERRLGPKELRDPEQYMDATIFEDAETTQPDTPAAERDLVDIIREGEATDRAALDKRQLKAESVAETAQDKLDADRTRQSEATRTKILQDTVANAGEVRRPDALRRLYETALTSAGIANAKATPKEMESLRRASNIIRAKDPVAEAAAAQEAVKDPRQLEMEARVAPKGITPLIDTKVTAPIEPIGRKADVTPKEIKPKASRTRVSPVGQDVAAQPKGGVSGVTDPKTRAKVTGTSGVSGVGSPELVTRPVDGPKKSGVAALKPVKRGPIPAGIKGVAKKPAPKETEAAQIERLWQEEASTDKKRDYRASDNVVKKNPFSEKENKKIKDKLLKGARKTDEGKKADVPVIAYLSRYPNPAEGLREAVIDQVDATVQTRSEKTDDPTARRAARLAKGTGGTKTKGEASPAFKAIAWARTNLGEQGNKWLDGQVAEAEANKGRRNVEKKQVEVILDSLGKPILSQADVAQDAIDSGYAAGVDRQGRRRDSSGNIIIDKALETDAVVGLDLPLDSSVVEAISAGDLGDALLKSSQTAVSRKVRQTAKVYAGLVGTTKLVTKKNLKAADGRSVAGLFDPKTNTITLDQDTGINMHTLMHEMTHAVTSAEIANKASSAGKQLNKLFNDVKEYLGTSYGATNADEFLAEAQSNQFFRAELAGINIKGEEVTALQRYLNIMNNVLSRYLPFVKSRNITLLQEVDSFVDGLLAPAPKYRNANQMAMMSTSEGVKKFMSTVIDKTQKSVSKGSRKQWGYDARDMLTQGFAAKAKRLLLGLSDSEGIGAIAESVGLGNMGYRLDDMITNQRGAIQTADKIIEQRITKILATLNKGTQEQAQRRVEILDDIIYNTDYGATIYQVDPTKDRNAYMTKKGEAKFDADGNNLLEVYDTLRKLWTSKEFGSEGRQAYVDMRDTYRDQYDKLRAVVLGQIDNIMEDSPEAKQLKNKIFSQLFDRSTLNVYFPLMREGDYVLRYNAKDPDLEGKRRGTIVQTFTTAAERDDAQRMVEADNRYKDVEASDAGVTAATYRNSADAGFAFETITILDKAKDKNGEALPTEVKDQVMQLFVKALPETSFAKSLQKRKGYPGYMQDSVLALKTKGYSIASQTAKLEYGAKLRQFTAELNNKELWGEPKDIPDAASIVGRGAKAITASFTDVKAELLNRAEFARQGAKTGDIEAIARRLNQTAFVYTIGFNASSAIVNLSQIPLFVTPYLAGKYDGGYVGSFRIPKTRAALAKAYGNTLLSGKRGGKINSIRDLYDVSADGTFTLKEGLTLPEGRAAELKRMATLVQTASNRGLLGQGYIAEAMGLNEAGRIKKGTRLGNALDNVSVFSASLFNFAEQLNRQVTLMASFDLALNKETNGKPENATQEQIDKAVKEAIHDTQKTNGGTFLETAPRYARSGVGRVAFMYKSYGLRMYHTMFQTAKIAFDSDKGKLFGPEGSPERRAAWKQLIGMHGAALFFAGVQGVPLYGAVRLMYNALFAGEDDEDFDTIVRTYIGEGWYKGAITKFSGVDVANRMALTGLLIQENRFNSNPSLEESIGFYAGGPALSVANRLFRGTKDLADGEFQRGVESILPAGVANAYKSTFGRYAQEGGIYTRRGDPIYDDMTVGELFAQTFGFPPTEYTFRQEQNASSKGIDIAVNKERSRLTKQYYIARRMGDFNRIMQLRKEMNEFGRKHPEARIDEESLRTSMRRHAETTKKMRKYNGVSISSLYSKTIDDLRRDWGD